MGLRLPGEEAYRDYINLIQNATDQRQRTIDKAGDRRIAEEQAKWDALAGIPGKILQGEQQAEQMKKLTAERKAEEGRTQALAEEQAYLSGQDVASGKTRREVMLESDLASRRAGTEQALAGAEGTRLQTQTAREAALEQKAINLLKPAVNDPAALANVEKMLAGPGYKMSPQQIESAKLKARTPNWAEKVAQTTYEQSLPLGQARAKIREEGQLYLRVSNDLTQAIQEISANPKLLDTKPTQDQLEDIAKKMEARGLTEQAASLRQNVFGRYARGDLRSRTQILNDALRSVHGKIASEIQSYGPQLGNLQQDEAAGPILQQLQYNDAVAQQALNPRKIPAFGNQAAPLPPGGAGQAMPAGGINAPQAQGAYLTPQQIGGIQAPQQQAPINPVTKQPYGAPINPQQLRQMGRPR